MITKEKFEAFTKMQATGKFNMANIGISSAICGLSKEDYIDILHNYSKYKEIYK